MLDTILGQPQDPCPCCISCLAEKGEGLGDAKPNCVEDSCPDFSENTMHKRKGKEKKPLEEARKE